MEKTKHSEVEFSSQEVFEWFSTKRFQREHGEQEYTMIYEIDLPKIINAFIKDKGLAIDSNSLKVIPTK